MDSAKRKPRSELHALVVEDEYMLSILLEDFLRSWGCGRISSEATAVGALSFIKHESLDLALLDIMLNGETSFEVAALLRSRDIPFIFATALNDKGIPPEWRKHRRLDKPFSLDQLCDALDKLFPS